MAFLDIFTEVKLRVTRGISFLLEGSPLSLDTGVLTPCGGRILDQDPREMPALLRPGPGLAIQLFRSVSVHGRCVTFAVFF